MLLQIVRDPIDPASLGASVQNGACGAVVLFAGVVRELSDDARAVTGLSYEAHEQMACAEFETIAAEALERFGPCRIAAAHRVGDLAVGEVAVAIAVASPHRARAFAVCEFLIDELKARAAIWKKEHYADGASTWRENDCQSPSPSN